MTGPTFPAALPVRHARFTGTGEDDMGNDVETWSAPGDVLVIAYQSGSVENVDGYTSKVVADIDMAVPPGLEVSVQDHFYLPGDDKAYEVVAIEDGRGFHGWRPGFVVKLNRVTGA